MATFISNGEPITSPSPQYDIPIVSNNGVLKVSKNLFTTDGATQDYAIDLSGTPTINTNFFYTKILPVTAGSVYTFSGVSGSDTTGFTRRVHCYIDGVWYSQLASFGNIGTVGQSYSATFTIPTGCNGLRVSMLKMDTNVQLELGSTATTYMPYGQIYTDGTVETVNVHGKNLFNYDQDISVESVSSGGIWQRYNVSIALSVGNWYAKKITNVNAGTYIASVYTSSGLAPFGNIFVYDGTQTTKYSSGSAITVTKPSEIWFMGGSSSSWNTIIKAQFERGSTITDWEPYYDGGTSTAEMLLKVGDYTDVQSIIDGVVTRNVGVKVLDGTEVITASSDNSYFSYNAGDKASGFIPSVPLPISTHFQTAPNTGTGSIPDNGIGASSTTSNKSIWFKMSAAQDVTAFKAFLADQYAAGTPVIVLYPLATPTTESVAGQTLQVQAGDNVLEITQASLNGLELEATYMAGATLTIQEVQDAQLSPDVEITIQ